MKLRSTADSGFVTQLTLVRYYDISNSKLVQTRLWLSAQVIGRKSNCVQFKEIVPVEGKTGQTDRADLF